MDIKQMRDLATIQGRSIHTKITEMKSSKEILILWLLLEKKSVDKNKLCFSKHILQNNVEILPI